MIMLHSVHAFQAAYARCIDDDRLESWPDFFLEHCLYRVTTADNHRRGLEAGLIWADSRGMLRDRITALREANIYERHSYRHIIGLPLAEEEEAGAIRAETPFLVVRTMRDGASSIFASGRYLDLFRRDEEGSLKLAERIVVCDASRIDTLLAIPL
jgi:anthranilate 1,2-dioxygenase small subunit